MKKIFGILGSLFLMFSLGACGETNNGSSDVSNNTYTITWKNSDGTVLETDSNVEYETTPTYDGAIPTKASDDQYTYSFSGWSPSIAQVISNATYTATFKNTLVNAQISFDLNGGTTQSDTSIKYASSITSDLFFYDVVKEDYNFRGWEYKGSKVVNQKGVQISNPAIEETMLFKAMFAQDTYLTISSNIHGAGSISGEGTYNYNTNVDVSVEVNQGYDFIGWYTKEVLLSNQTTYKYMMWSEDVELEAKFVYLKYDLNISSAHPLLGSVMVKGDLSNQDSSTHNFSYKDSITIAAYTKTDKYRFLGWYDNKNNLVDTNAVYTFIMPNYEYDLIARWDTPSFNVIVTKQYTNAATIVGAGAHEYNSNVELEVITNEGYEFVGWYKENNLVSNESKYKFNMVFDELNFKTRFNLAFYSIVYTLNGGTNNSSNPTSYTVEDNILLNNPSKAGYTFEGWTLSGKNIDEIDIGTTGNLTLVATWSINSYQVTVTSSDTNKGTVTGSGSYEYGSSVTVEATPIGDNVFNGWYEGSELKSTNKQYSFVMNDVNVNLTAKFITPEEEWNIAHGVTPTLSGNTLIYGLYPQSVVDNSSLVNSLNSLTDSSKQDNGYYFYDNEYYYPYIAKPCENYSFKYHNGSNIVSGTKYWFKCEPIEWKVLKLDNDQYTITTTKLLDAHCYYESSDTRKLDGKTIYANNYEYSSIRKWLNEDFYDMAFFLNDSNILTTLVDNSVASAGDTTNKYACNDTNDKVYLLSYKDLNNSSYGFSSDKSRQCKTSDFARARGAYSYTSSSYLNNGYYWTRSPYYDQDYLARNVDFMGDIHNLDTDIVTDTNGGVRPTLTLTFKIN